MGVEEKTRSHDPTAHARDPRERRSPPVPGDLTVLRPGGQEIEVRSGTVSGTAETHAPDSREQGS